METPDKARKFVEEIKTNIKNLDGESREDHISKFEDRYGEITDYPSFKNFYLIFLEDCPNQEIVKGHKNEEEAHSLWESIDINKNNKLDKEERIILLKAVANKTIEMIEKYFNL